MDEILRPDNSGVVTSLVVIVVGSSGVGKKTLIAKFSEDRKCEIQCFDDEELCAFVVDGQTICLSLVEYSLEGESRLKSSLQTLSGGECVVMALFDVTNRESLDALKSFYSSLESIAANPIARTPLFVVGNKTDLADRRAVQQDEGRAFAESLGCKYMEACAQTKENLDELFCEMYRASHPPSASPSTTDNHSEELEHADHKPDKKKKKCIVM